MAETKKMVLGIQDVDDLADEDPMPTEPMTLNMGPSHPAMHGTVRIILTVEGETVKDADVQVGYLHRCFEKESEHATYTQVFPYTDRLNYVSPMLNNVGYALAVEKLLGIVERMPERAQYIRVIVGELSRIADHLTCMSAGAMELGAMTIYFWGIKAREWIWEMLEELSGARMTHSYVRVGGLAYDLTPDFIPKIKALFPKINDGAQGHRGLALREPHLPRPHGRHRRHHAGARASATAGPGRRCARRASTTTCARRTRTSSTIASTSTSRSASNGDNFDRYILRMEEVRQSMRILEQAFKQIPEGPVCLDDPRIILPPKPAVYNTIEGMISHFKIIVDGVKVPPGEVYSYTEGGNGELGFYIVSDGTGRPYKCRVRGPCFMITSALSEMIVNRPIADIVPTFDMMNMIGGECDR